MHVCVCVGVGACKCVFAHRGQRLKYIAYKRLFFDMDSHWLWSSAFGQTSGQHLPEIWFYLPSAGIIVFPATPASFMWALGMKSMSVCLYGECFAYEAIPPATVCFQSKSYTLACFIMCCSLGGKANELAGTFLFCCSHGVGVSDLVSASSVHRNPRMIVL